MCQIYRALRLIVLVLNVILATAKPLQICFHRNQSNPNRAHALRFHILRAFQNIVLAPCGYALQRHEHVILNASEVYIGNKTLTSEVDTPFVASWSSTYILRLGQRAEGRQILRLRSLV